MVAAVAIGLLRVARKVDAFAERFDADVRPALQKTAALAAAAAETSGRAVATALAADRAMDRTADRIDRAVAKFARRAERFATRSAERAGMGLLRRVKVRGVPVSELAAVVQGIRHGLAAWRGGS